MNSFRQHIPNYAYDPRDGKPPEYEFETIEELLALNVIQPYKKDKNFHRFVMGDFLMIVSKDGYHWWVVGYIKYPDLVNLEKWEGPKYRKENKIINWIFKKVLKI